MQPTYSAQYRELYENHWWWRAREEILVEILQGIASKKTDLKILDVGCNDGLFFPKLKRFGHPEGVEPDELCITEKGRALGKIFAGTLEDFRPSSQYDLILMLDVIEHLPDEKPILVRARTLLSKGGQLLITVPAFQCLWTNHDNLNMHCRRYTIESLRRVLGETGFSIERIHYLFLWPAVVKFLLHHIEKVTAHKADKTGIPPRIINQFLLAICKLEYGILKSWGVPFGSSVIAVASLNNE